MMVIDNKFQFGQTVFLKTDIDQFPRILTKMLLTPVGITYCLSAGCIETWHYDIEIAVEEDKELIAKYV